MKTLLKLTFVVIITSLILSCQKDKNDDNTNPVPIEKKKFVWACGQPDSTGYGMILFSADGGDNWMRQGVGSTALLGNELQDIWAVDEKNVWAVGINSLVRTIDGGQTWTLVEVPFITQSQELYSISIFNKTNIWVSGNNGTVLNSNDNGNTWKTFDPTYFNHAFFQGIAAISKNKIYLAGGIGELINLRGYIAYTEDEGNTWDSLVLANNYNKNEWIGVCSFENVIVVYGGKSHFVVSKDGGTTWNNDSVPNTGGGGGGADINHLIMLNSQTWWGAFDMGQIYITTDGGANWLKQQTVGLGQFYMLGIDAWDSQLAIAVGAQAGPSNNCPIIKTSNGGALWEQKYTTSNSTLRKVTFIKD